MRSSFSLKVWACERPHYLPTFVRACREHTIKGGLMAPAGGPRDKTSTLLEHDVEICSSFSWLPTWGHLALVHHREGRYAKQFPVQNFHRFDYVSARTKWSRESPKPTRSRRKLPSLPVSTAVEGASTDSSCPATRRPHPPMLSAGRSGQLQVQPQGLANCSGRTWLSSGSARRYEGALCTSPTRMGAISSDVVLYLRRYMLACVRPARF